MIPSDREDLIPAPDFNTARVGATSPPYELPTLLTWDDLLPMSSVPTDHLRGMTSFPREGSSKTDLLEREQPAKCGRSSKNHQTHRFSPCPLHGVV